MPDQQFGGAVNDQLVAVGVGRLINTDGLLAGKGVDIDAGFTAQSTHGFMTQPPFDSALPLVMSLVGRRRAGT